MNACFQCCFFLRAFDNVPDEYKEIGCDEDLGLYRALCRARYYVLLRWADNAFDAIPQQELGAGDPGVAASDADSCQWKGLWNAKVCWNKRWVLQSCVCSTIIMAFLCVSFEVGDKEKKIKKEEKPF